MSRIGRDEAGTVTGEDEVVDLCRDLIRIDTSNYGDHSGPGNGPPPSTSPRSSPRWGSNRRSSSPAPGPGLDRGAHRRARTRPGRRCSSTGTRTSCRPTPTDWTHHPFSGEIADGCVWGRGAVDMKDMDAMTLAVVRDRLRTRPQAAARHRARLPRRRGGRRRVRGPAPGRQPPGPVRGRHRGHRRGRRLLLHGQRGPAAVPDRDRPEGHALDAAHRGRHRRATAR